MDSGIAHKSRPGDLTPDRGIIHSTAGIVRTIESVRPMRSGDPSTSPSHRSRCTMAALHWRIPLTQFFFKMTQFQVMLGENPILSKFGLSPPPWGQNSAGSPLTKILDPPLESLAQMHNGGAPRRVSRILVIGTKNPTTHSSSSFSPHEQDNPSPPHLQHFLLVIYILLKKLSLTTAVFLCSVCCSN